MKTILAISLSLTLIFPVKLIQAQDTARVYDYAILSFLERPPGYQFGMFAVQFNDGKLFDLTDALKFPVKIPRNVAVLDYVSNKEDYNSCLLKCFDYLNKQAFELVSFDKNDYIFKRPHHANAK